jgi:hypothetical protein
VFVARTRFVAGSAAGQLEHDVPFADGIFDLAVALEDSRQQTVGGDVARVHGLRPSGFCRSLRTHVVVQQHLGQPQVTGHAATGAVTQRGPDPLCILLVAALELGFADADDRHLVLRIDAAEALPPRERARRIAPARSGECQLGQRGPIAGEARERTIQGRSGVVAPAAAHLSVDEVYHRSRVRRHPARQRLARVGRFLIPAQTIQQRYDLSGQIGIAWREFLGRAKRRQRALQITELVSHLAEHLVFADPGAGARLLDRSGDVGQGSSLSRRRERERPHLSPPFGVGSRQLPQ